jgi:hypothetical protein
MDLEMIRRMLRHRDSRSTERYAELADGALVEAFTRARPRRTERSDWVFVCVVCVQPIFGSKTSQKINVYGGADGTRTRSFRD